MRNIYKLVSNLTVLTEVCGSDVAPSEVALSEVSASEVFISLVILDPRSFVRLMFSPGHKVSPGFANNTGLTNPYSMFPGKGLVRQSAMFFLESI